MSASSSKFTFLNYDSPDHGASHRKVVKAHISSKYRATVRQQDQPRYALPQRYLHTSLPVADQDESGSGSTAGPRKKRKQRQDVVVATEQLSRRPPSPWEISFTGTRVDPFNALPGQGTPCVLSAMDYYTQVLSPLYKPMLLALNVVNPMLTWTLPLFLRHEDAFHAIIAVAQTYVERSRGRISTPSKEVQFHRWKAASALRDKLSRLEGAPDDAAILAVLGLACLDVLFQELGTINRNGLGLMVAMRGGLNNLGSHGMVKAYLVQFDYFWMLELNRPTIFPFSRRKEHRTYPQHPFDSSLRDLIGTMPPGFRAVAIQNSLGVDVLQILSRVSQYVGSRSSGNGSINEGGKVSDGQGYPDIFDACSCLHSSPTTEHSLEKNLCLAVILLSFNVYSPTTKGSENLAPYRGSRQELTRSLPACEFRTPEERNCLIWIWMVVVGSWRVDGVLSPKAISLGDVFLQSFEEARSWDQMEGILRQFLWYEPLAEVWKLCWQEARDVYQSQHRSYLSGAQRDDSLVTREDLSANETPVADLPERRRSESLHSEEVQRSRESSSTTTIPPMLTLEGFVSQLQ